jgi:heat shock protein
VVAFGEKQRILGVAAKNQLVTNIKNTVYSFKRLLGRPFEDPEVQAIAPQFPYQLVKDPKFGGVSVKVRYLGQEETFTVEQITAMLFTKLKESTEIAIKAKVSDCVISVSEYE